MTYCLQMSSSTAFKSLILRDSLPLNCRIGNSSAYKCVGLRRVHGQSPRSFTTARPHLDPTSHHLAAGARFVDRAGLLWRGSFELTGVPGEGYGRVIPAGGGWQGPSSPRNFMNKKGGLCTRDRRQPNE
jgi:hypothetical protein